MITMEGKLNVFTKLVLEKVQNEYEEKKREIDEENNRIISERRKEIKKRADKIIDNIVNRGEIEKNRLISRAKINKKRVVLGKKEELLDKLIHKIEKLAHQFTYEENYQAYLENSIHEVLENLKNRDSIILFLTEKDISKFNKVIEKLIEERGFDDEKVELQSLKPVLIGGVIGMDREKTIKVDCSIKTKIDDNRNLIGQILYEAFYPRGGVDD